MKPLSTAQKSALVMMARRAFDRLVSRKEIADIDFNTWRHETVERVTGKAGLRECVNSEYSALASAFEDMAGNGDEALNHLLREQSEPRRQAEFVLVREMERGGFGPTYVETICKAQFKCAVADATADQLRKLTFTVRNRATARRRAAESTSHV